MGLLDVDDNLAAYACLALLMTPLIAMLMMGLMDSDVFASSNIFHFELFLATCAHFEASQ